MGSCHWLLLSYFLLLFHISYEATSSQINGEKYSKRATLSWRRSPGFFGMISQFIRETITDTNSAVRNITAIINAEFPSGSQAQNITGGNSTSVSGARQLSLSEVNTILGRNYRSLVRLFNTEFRNAIADSNKNIRRYRQEFKDAVRPYFTDGALTSTTTPRTTTSAN